MEAELLKYTLSGSVFDEKSPRKLTRDWWKNYLESGSMITEKIILYMEAGLIKKVRL